MKKTAAALLAVLALGTVACESRNDTSNPNNPSSPSSPGTRSSPGTPSTTTPSRPSTSTPPDTNRPNATRPDTSGGGAASSGSSDNASESDADKTVSSAVRRAIMEDSNLSTTAQNLKITTNNGVVTLRGTVNSQQEKDSIESKAKGVTGVTRINNQLEVKGG